MDDIYYSIKGLLKAFLNLFLAFIDLVSGLINGLAAIRVRLRPHISQRYTELKDGKVIKGKESILNTREQDEILVEEIRNELKQKVTSREKYYYLNACASNEGIGFYAVIVSVLLFALSGISMVFGISYYIEVRIAGIVMMFVLCLAACIIIIRHQKKILKNKLMKQILEEEFANSIRDQADSALKQQPEQVTDISTRAVNF